MPAVDKVQLMTPLADESETCIPCAELLETGSDALGKLLSPI